MYRYEAKGGVSVGAASDQDRRSAGGRMQREKEDGMQDMSIESIVNNINNVY